MNSAPPTRAPLARRLLLGAAGLAALIAGAYTAAHFGHGLASAPHTTVAAVYPEPRVLPAFSFGATDGAAFDAARLKGHYTFLLFGYTSCPDVCPTTLLELARARQLLADLPPAARPRVVMVSVDPQRDSAERLTLYVTHFDPSFVGVTGGEAAIDAFALAVGAAVERPTARAGNYTVDHTAAVFLINPAARVAAVFPTPHVAATLAADFRAIRHADGG